MTLVVETHGTFVYRALSRVGLRSQPSVGDESRLTGVNAVVNAGALVAVDCVLPSRTGSNDNGV